MRRRIAALGCLLALAAGGCAPRPEEPEGGYCVYYSALSDRFAPLPLDCEPFEGSGGDPIPALVDALLSPPETQGLATPFDKTMKVGAAVAAARRGGLSSTFDELNKFFTISGMPVASSQYWNMVYGGSAEEVAQDAEGLQTMRTLGRNMAFMMKSFRLGKEQFGLPQKETPIFTNFYR